jgi:2-keto-4-pentenoate hydratase/2-oxohepta-3-ene-1,7-dioic acid hydratase in catechol pathway
MGIDKIICVGKNYLAHAQELGDAIPEKPVLFLKPPSVLRQVSHWGEELELDYPLGDSQVQPECEIVLRLAQDAYCINIQEAKQAISHLSIGLDMTLRTRQTALKKQGHPWTTAKVFQDAAILGPWIAYADFPHYLDEVFKLKINGNLKQSAKGSEMMMQPLDLLVYISQFFPLKAGDLIYTGTPAGVTSIEKGSVAELSWSDYRFCVQWR